MTSVCIFCGSKSGLRKEYTESAQHLGRLFVQHNIAMVYGGATNGLMGTIADTMMSAGGKVIGVIPTLIAERELAHKGISELHIVSSMSERKTKMLELSDAFITLPGGVGTMDEMFEVLAFTHLRVNEKLVGVLNILGFYDSLLKYVDHAVAEGFVPEHVKEQIIVAAEPKQLLSSMKLI
ncbi:MAG: TIGR00730 family Rossman fold protein [Bacteroidota bacterium]